SPTTGSQSSGSAPLEKSSSSSTVSSKSDASAGAAPVAVEVSSSGAAAAGPAATARPAVARAAPSVPAITPRAVPLIVLVLTCVLLLSSAPTGAGAPARLRHSVEVAAPSLTGRLDLFQAWRHPPRCSARPVPPVRPDYAGQLWCSRWAAAHSAGAAHREAGLRSPGRWCTARSTGPPRRTGAR